MGVDLDRELTELRRKILTMGSLVEQRVRDAIEALLQRQPEIAQRVRSGDREIDAMDVAIEAECLHILALSQPVAADLRFVLAVLRMNTDLERVGDEAKSIAKRVLDLTETTPSLEIPPMMREMANASCTMLSESLTALAEEDVELCRRVREADERVDELQKKVFAWVTDEITRNVGKTRAAIDLLSVARRLERIADLATNIAEDVIFLIEGAQVRHVRG